jgi:predicted enzyme related to lactoylglutathione lyase
VTSFICGRSRCRAERRLARFAPAEGDHMLKRVHSTFYWIKDMEQAVGFYRDVLGLDLRARYGEDWTEFEIDGSTIALHGSRGMAPPNEGATVVFEVDDLDVTMRALSTRGVSFEGEVTEVPESGRFVSLRDPAGNLVQIFEPPAGERR